jgi:simple sugar transport system ATP-binding protein
MRRRIVLHLPPGECFKKTSAGPVSVIFDEHFEVDIDWGIRPLSPCSEKAKLFYFPNLIVYNNLSICSSLAVNQGVITLAEAKYIIEMLNITKEFPGVKANDNITLQLKKGEIHALLGENGAGKSTLMSVLFGLYQADEGIIKKNGEIVKISNPNDANALNIGMVHQHFMLVECFSVLDNIILGVEPEKFGFLQESEGREKIVELSEKYGLHVEPDALIEDISVGMQQRVEILKMLYRDNEILIFDEPTAVLTPQEIQELMEIMRGFTREGKSILFITHKLQEIMDVSDRVTVLRRGKCIGTVNTADTTVEELSSMMVGREVSFMVEKADIKPGEIILDVEGLTVPSRLHKNNAVKNVSFNVRQGEIVCLAGIEGNGQNELIYALTGLEKQSDGSINLCGHDISKSSIRDRSIDGMSHIPADRHKYGLILDYTLEENMVLERYWEPKFQKNGFIKFEAVRDYSDRLIEQYDVRSGQGSTTVVRSMSGGNQQKAIVAREIDKNPDLLVAVQPTRGLDVGAIEYIHKQLVAQRDDGKAVLLVSLELDEVMNVSDRILVMYEGEIVGEFDPKTTTVEELGLYMAGAKRNITKKEVNTK